MFLHYSKYICAIFLYSSTVQICVPKGDEVKTVPVHAMNENAGVNV